VRRFIRSLPGKVVSQLLALSLLLPTVSLGLVGRAEAQLQQLPAWAVTEFVDQVSPGSPYQAAAAEAVSTELARTQRYDVQPQDTVKRALETLGLQTPVTDITSLSRLGQELRANTIVTGRIVDYKIRRVNGGKQALVAMQVTAYDVSSGLGVNGASVQGSSTVRAGDVPDATLITEAINTGAALAVGQIENNTLPNGTVLNTFEDTALINQGSRTGFKPGQDVIVTRGRDQVATARVIDVDPDQATVRVQRSWKGIQPGDKVRAVFVPPITQGVDLRNAGNSGRPIERQPRKHTSNAGFFSLLLVVGLGAVLLGNGGASGQGASSDVRAEAVGFPDASGLPAVKISWSPNLFHKGNTQRFAWQLFRSDVPDSPVLVVPGGQTFAYDTTDPRVNLNFYDFGGVIGGTTCDFSAPPASSAANVPGVQPGRPYVYSVSLVYVLNAIDLPDGGTGATSGNTGGTNTGGNTGGTNTTGNTGGTNTGGNTGGTGGTGGTVCYFTTARDTAVGLATPLAPPQLQAPAEGAAVAPPSPGDPINDQITFTFNSAVTANPITVAYAIEVSTSPLFTKATTRLVGTKISGATGTVSISASNNFLTTEGTIVYWRVGARNVADNPGPVKDAIGQRYVWSTPRSFTRPGSPPPPPAAQ
jgi:hypothetical protein